MKKKSFTLLVVAAICSSMMFSSCIGSFGLTNKLLSWNKSVGLGSMGSKFASEAVFFLFWVLPVYEVSIFLDAIIINSIEFWSGSNPVADTGTKTIETENGIYTVETKTDRLFLLCCPLMADGFESRRLLSLVESNRRFDCPA